MTAAFLVYFASLLLIAGLAWWRTRDLGDYLLGGRRLGPTSAALSAGASDMSAWLLLGLPGYAYLSGLESVWLALGLLAGSYGNWRWVAPRLRAATVDLGNALTIPEFFARRATGGGRRALRLVAAAMIFAFYLFYTASGFVAGAKLFETVYGLDYQLALLLGVGVILAYTFWGGFLAVVWTDVLQGLLMLLALLFVPLFVWSEDSSALRSPVEWGSLLPLNDSGGIAWVALLSLLAWGLGYFGQPHILARFMALRASASMVTARRIATTWTALCLLGAMAVGLAGQGALPAELADAETVFIRLVELLFHPVIAGVLLAAILAAIMSTADSQLLVASSVLSEDLCAGLLGLELSERRQLWVGRLAVVVMTALAMTIAWSRENAVLDLVAYAWAGFGASFGPAVVYALYADRVSARVLLAGIVSGGGTVVIWRQLEGGWFNLYELLPGVVAATLSMLVLQRASAAGSVADSVDDRG